MTLKISGLGEHWKVGESEKVSSERKRRDVAADGPVTDDDPHFLPIEIGLLFLPNQQLRESASHRHQRR